MTDCAEQPESAKPAAQSSIGTGRGAFFQRMDWLSFGVTAVVMLVVYLRTIAPEVTLEFSGTLSTSAKYAGVANPPGYPIWTVYSWLFAKLLPVSNIAWRVAVGSAVAAALASGLVALMVSRAGAMLLETMPGFTRQTPADKTVLRSVCGFVAGMALGEIWAFGVLLFTIMLSLLPALAGRARPETISLRGIFCFRPVAHRQPGTGPGEPGPVAGSPIG